MSRVMKTSYARRCGGHVAKALGALKLGSLHAAHVSRGCGSEIGGCGGADRLAGAGRPGTRPGERVGGSE
jgi:hypothetical protein